MAVGFPCPNPSCKNLFRLEDIQGLATISCPKCKKIFSMRQGGASQVAGKPAADLSQGSPLQPNTTPTPAASKVPNPTPGGSRKKKKPSITPFQWLFLLFGFLVIGMTVLLAIKVGLPFIKKEMAPAKVLPKENNLLEGSFFHMVLPANYTQDPELAKKTKTQIALVLPKKSFILYVNKDYKTRQPTEAERNLEMLSRLEGLFTKKFEWEPATEPGPLGGFPATEFRFEGEMEDQTFWTGKCFSSIHKGVLFLMIHATSPEFATGGADSWKQFLNSFQIRMEARANWEPTPRKLKSLAIKDLETNIRIPEEVWNQQATDGYPMKPFAVFIGKNPSDIGNFGNQKAYLYCFSNTKGSAEEKTWESPAANLLQILNEEPGEKSNLEKLSTGPRSKKPDPGIKSHFFQLKDQDAPIKYIEAHQIPTPKGSLVLVIESPWKNKDYWSDEVNEILNLAKPAN